MSNDRPTSRRSSMAPWVFALSCVPILAAAGWGLLAFARHPDEAKDRGAREALSRLLPAVEASLEDRAEDLGRLGAVIARDPKFFAVLTLPQSDRSGADFQSAVLGVLRDFQRDAGVPLFAVTDERGEIIARVDTRAGVEDDLSNAPFIRRAIEGKPGYGYVVGRGAMYRVAAVPVSAGGVLVGVLCLGEGLDETGSRLKDATGCDLAFLSGKTIASTTLPPSPLRKALAQELGTPGPSSKAAIRAVAADGRTFLALRRALPDSWRGTGPPSLLLVRAVESDASPLGPIRDDLVRAGLLGLALSFACGGITLLAIRRSRRMADRAHAAELASLRAASLERAELLAGVAEEIVEPSSTVETVADLIADGALGNLSEPQREGVAAIRVATTTLARVGRDLEHLSLMDRGALTLSLGPADLGAIVERAAIVMFPLASSRRQTISLSVEPDLLHPAADAGRLARAVQSLAHHAVCSFPEGSRVELAARTSGAGITVEISDSEAQGRPGQGGESAGAAGALALRVATLIVERHGGYLRMGGVPGGGWSYTIEIPFSGSAAVAGSSEAPDEPLALAG